MISPHFKPLIITSIFILLSFTLSMKAAKEYHGTVVTLQTNTIASGTDYSYYGSVEQVARLGKIITPQITDTDGKIIKQGTVLIKLKQEYWEDRVLAAKSAVNSAKADLLTDKENLERYRSLTSSVSKVASMQAFQAARATYYDSLSKLDSNVAALLETQLALAYCTQVAPFEGIVDEVMYSSGPATANPATIKISQLNPIGIKVKMSRDEANQIKIDTPVKIINELTNTSQGVFYGYSLLCKDGIIFRTSNQMKEYDSNSNKNIQRVNNCMHVVKFYTNDLNSKILAVPETSLIKDNKKYYVWRAVNQKSLQPNQGINRLFKVEKVYVKPANLQRIMEGFTMCRSLKDSGKLELHDLILTELPSKPLKNGDTVTFNQERYELMPGDTVQVIIGTGELEKQQSVKNN
ncbi:MAG TPA: hypothetical protein QF753_02135 [Victivallales bacterium]|nr:hypothetical protein [Victivallales bacterium]